MSHDAAEREVRAEAQTEAQAEVERVARLLFDAYAESVKPTLDPGYAFMWPRSWEEASEGDVKQHWRHAAQAALVDRAFAQARAASGGLKPYTVTEQVTVDGGARYAVCVGPAVVVAFTDMAVALDYAAALNAGRASRSAP